MTLLLHPLNVDAPATTPRYRAWHAAVAGMWIAAVIAGFLAMAKHSYTPGQASSSMSDWPLADRLPLDHALPTLVMSLHAQCPCSRASLAELGELLEQNGGGLRAVVLIENPIRAGEPTDGTLWRQAAALPGVQVIDDIDGQLALRLDAETSGQAFLYDTHGTLRFSGGITASRGHVGANDGADAIEAILSSRPSSDLRSTTPVFGCALR